MAQISDYPISFPYGATSPPYSPTRPHRGDDRAAPQGTPVLVEGVRIGLVGSTGLSTGPHLHLQEWQGTPANTRKPQNSFKGGKVVAATSASDFGNYVTIQTADGWNDTYAHLSQINVSVGQVIGGTFMIDKNLLFNYFRFLLGRAPTEKENQIYIGMPSDVVFQTIVDSTEYMNIQKAKEDRINHLLSQEQTLAQAVVDRDKKIAQLESSGGYEPINETIYRRK